MNDPSRPSAPPLVLDLAAAGADFVERALKVAVDYTPDTLPIVDHYLRSIPKDAKAEVLSLVVPAVGAYFGEVVRRALGDSRWAIPTPSGEDGDDHDYGAFRLEFERCFLYFNPIAVALEAAHGRDAEGYDASFGVLEQDRAFLAEALSRSAPVDEDDFYRLVTRFETLEHVIDLLVARAAQRGESVVSYGPELYANEIEGAKPAHELS